MLGDLLLDHATLTTFVLENFAPLRAPTDRTVKLKNTGQKNKCYIRKGSRVRGKSSPGQPQTPSTSTCSQARTGSALQDTMLWFLTTFSPLPALFQFSNTNLHSDKPRSNSWNAPINYTTKISCLQSPSLNSSARVALHHVLNSSKTKNWGIDQKMRVKRNKFKLELKEWENSVHFRTKNLTFKS